jgi:hypothetical protein
MANITDEEWQELYDGLDSASLLAAVDAIDRIRPDLSDGDGGRPPEIRDNLLRLHQLAMAVQTNATPALLTEFFDLAGDLDDQVMQLLDSVEQVQSTLSAVMALYPESLSYDDLDQS